MADFNFDTARIEAMNGTLEDMNSETAYHAMLIEGTTPLATQATITAMLATGTNEAGNGTPGSYVRLTLTTTDVNVVAGEARATKITFILPSVSGPTTGVVIYRGVVGAGSDGTNIPYAWREISPTATHDGGTLEIRFNGVDGVGKWIECD